MRTRWFVLTLSITLFSGIPARADLDHTTVWGHDFAAAEAEAARLRRPLVVHFCATWCGPCRKMEKELLHTQQVMKTLDAGFVAVKVDVDKNPKVQARFKVKGLPTDIILGTDGKVLARSEGYDGAPTKQKYLNNISQIDNQFAKAGTRLSRTAPDVDVQRPVATNSVPAVPDRALASKDKLVPPPTEPRKVDMPAESTIPGTTPQSDDVQDGSLTADPVQIQVAMDGYCPVTLRTSRTWKTGSKDIALEHDGQVFYFTAAEKRDEFKAHPDRFAPQLLGCDPVVLADSDLVVRGSTKFGAFYEGSLFLFESADSRTKFKKTPARYSQLKHALKPEDVKKLASTSDK